MNIIITCEHASDNIPEEYSYLLKGSEKILTEHRVFDAGAAHTAKLMGSLLKVEPIMGRISRIIVDMNRSPENKDIFTEFSRKLHPDERQMLIKTYHQPFRNEVLKHVCLGKPVFHISVHSFTPVLGNRVRKADIGILYDPSRQVEKSAAELITKQLRGQPFKVMKNSPYQGKTDGTAAWLRKQYPESEYVGFELELNQRLLNKGVFPTHLIEDITNAFKKASEI